MGFFSNIKKNLNHGGVKVSIQGPNPVRLQDPTANLQVHIENTGDTPATINTVRVTLEYDERSTNPEQVSTNRMNVSVAAYEMKEPFVLQAKEVKQQTIVLPLTVQSAMNAAADSGVLSTEAAQTVQGAAGILGKAMDVAQMYGQMTTDKQRDYMFKIVADVEGVSFDPSATQRVQVLKPNEIGGAHFKIGF